MEVFNIMKAILFGAGEMTMKFLEKEEYSQYDIQAVADNDEKKHGSRICFADRCFDVVFAEEILSYNFDIVIITVSDYGCQLGIMEQLLELGIPHERIKFFRDWQVVKAVKLLDKPKGYLGDVLFFDVTDISKYDKNTGIQRVVKELYRNMVGLGVEICPIRYLGDKWITNRWFDSCMRNKQYDNIEYRLKDNNLGEVLFADSVWEYSNLVEVVKKYQESSFVVYDLIPILYPEFYSDVIRTQFAKWIGNGLQYCSKCICISETVADDVASYYEHNGFKRDKPLEIHVMHLGFDLYEAHGEVRVNIKDFVAKSMTFLIVGTVEIRKNHLLLLQSLRKMALHFPEKKIQLLIMGKDGWLNNEFKKMYYEDRLLQERVLWIKDASDSEIQWAYQHCVALVYPSKIEGFGLPLIEAAHFHLPIICSDIPIFREVMGDCADYFSLEDSNSITDTLEKWIHTTRHPDSGEISFFSWKECTSELVNILGGMKPPYTVVK